MLKSKHNTYSFLLAKTAGYNASKLYKVEYAYDETKKAYKSKLVSYNIDEDRNPASLSKKGQKGFSLSTDSPKYIKNNLPNLNNGIKNLIRKNAPFLPPN